MTIQGQPLLLGRLVTFKNSLSIVNPFGFEKKFCHSVQSSDLLVILIMQELAVMLVLWIVSEHEQSHHQHATTVEIHHCQQATGQIQSSKPLTYH